MNKRGFAEGLSWFFAIIATALILILFFVATNFYFGFAKQSEKNFYLGDFYKLDSLRQLTFMEEYDHQGVYNSFNYNIYGTLPENFLVDSVLANFLNKISLEIFSKADSASMTFNFGSKHIDWSNKSMSASDNFFLSDDNNLISNLETQGITGVSYQNIWDFVPGNLGYSILSSDGRLYRVYFRIKSLGFVRFGISAVQK